MPRQPQILCLILVELLPVSKGALPYLLVDDLFILRIQHDLLVYQHLLDICLLFLDVVEFLFFVELFLVSGGLLKVLEADVAQRRTLIPLSGWQSVRGVVACEDILGCVC